MVYNNKCRNCGQTLRLHASGLSVTLSGCYFFLLFALLQQQGTHVHGSALARDRGRNTGPDAPFKANGASNGCAHALCNCEQYTYD